MRIVIVGNGPAAASAIEAFRQVDQDSEIIVLSDEPYPTYAPNCMENVIRGTFQSLPSFTRVALSFTNATRWISDQTRRWWVLITKERW